MKKMILLLVLFTSITIAAPLDSNFIYVVYKIGDAENGIKDREPITYIDPLDYNSQDYGKTFSPWMKKVYLIVKRPRLRIDRVKTQLLLPPGHRRRVNLKALDVLYPGIEDKLRSTSMKDTVDVIDNDDNGILESLTLNIPKKDYNAVSSGAYTVGSGGDYATWSLAFADITDLTNNLNFTQISETTEAAAASVSSNLNGYTLNINGNKNYVSNVTFAQDFLNFLCEGPGTLFVNNFSGRRGVAGDLVSRGYILFASINTTFTANIYCCAYNGNSVNGSGVRINDNTPIINIYSSFFYNASNGIYIQTANSLNKYENNTFYSGGVGMDLGSSVCLVQNTASFDNTTDFLNISNATGNNNASSDATAANANWSTGTGNLTNLVATDDFLSLTSTDLNFLQPKVNGNLDKAGTSVAITGHDRYYNNVLIKSGSEDVGAKGTVSESYYVSQVLGPYQKPAYYRKPYRFDSFIKKAYK